MLYTHLRAEDLVGRLGQVHPIACYLEVKIPQELRCVLFYG